MTPQQHQAEAGRASILHSQAAGRIYDNTQGAMADIHRRVVSEPWYGRDVFDSTYNQQMGYYQSQGPAQSTEQGASSEANALNSFYGSEHGPDAGKGPGRGIEP